MQKKNLPSESVITLLLSMFCLYASRAYALPVAALLSPVFMIRFLRNQKLLPGSLILATTSSITLIFAFRGLIGAMFNSTIIFCVTMIVTTVIGLIPLFLDRYYSSRISTWKLTLIYPALKTFLEYAGSLNSPFGEWGASSALFAGWLPLSQIVSVTGIWGLSFLISWSASFINFVWDKRADWREARVAIFVYSGVFLFVIGFGSVRLLNNHSTPTVRVAAIIANESLQSPVKKTFYAQLTSFSRQHKTDSVIYFKEKFKANNDLLLNETRKAADKGAKIIFWAEGNGMILKTDEPALIQQASDLSKEKGIYLGMSVEVYSPEEKFPVENKIVLFKPDGVIAWEYYKHYPIGVENKMMVARKSGIKTLQTPYGKIAAVICFDSDFILFAREAGKANADILFAPSNDWKDIATLRGKITRFRALENGVTLVRPTSHGVTEMIDSKGWLLYENDYFKNPQTIVLTDVPVKGSKSLYAHSGDWFAILSLIIFLVIIIMQDLKKIKLPGIKKPATIGLFLLITIIPSLQAQTNTDTAKKNKIILFPAISCAPETSLALGVSAVRLFVAGNSGVSQVTTTGLYTFKNQFLFESNAQVYLRENQYMLKANFKFDKYPKYFFGIGNHTDNDSKNVVTYNVLKLEAAMMKQVAAHFYTGIKIHFSDYFNVSTEQEVKDVTGERGGITTGLGFSALYDTRDDMLASSKGVFAEVSSTWHSTGFGGRFDYYSLDADVRKFLAVSKNMVVALQALAQLKAGDVPFLQLSYLGGSNIMRGYYSGRYRDKNLIAAQAEIRRQLNRKWGVVLFGGLGEVMSSTNHFSVRGLHTSFGGGFRRRISKTEKVNLRMDVGFVNGKSDFYVNITEAF